MRLSDANRSSFGLVSAAAAGARTPSPGRDGRFTSPLGVRVGWFGGGSDDHAGCDPPGEGRSKTDREATTVSWSDDSAAGSTGSHAGGGGGTGSGGQGAAGGSGVDGPARAGLRPAMAAPGRIPWGGVTGALVTASEVSSVGGMWTVAVMPLPGELSSRTRMPWRAARLPAT
jgi:hypothetical protein